MGLLGPLQMDQAGQSLEVLITSGRFLGSDDVVKAGDKNACPIDRISRARAQRITSGREP